MKFIAYMFAGIFFISILISPATELVGVFTDKMRIDAAITAASSAAVLTTDDYYYTRDVDSKIILSDFEERFRENFREIFNLYSSYESRDGKFNRFYVEITPRYKDRETGSTITRIDSSGDYLYNECIIKVSTEYMFKTSFMKKYYKSTASYSPFILTRTKKQTLTVTN